MTIARAGTMLGVAIAGGAMCMLLTGCYSLAVAIHDAPMPPGTPQAVADEQLVGAWRDEEGGSVTFAANGTFVAKGICGDFSDWSGQLPDPVDSHSLSGSGSWKSSTWTPPTSPSPSLKSRSAFPAQRRCLGSTRLEEPQARSSSGCTWATWTTMTCASRAGLQRHQPRLTEPHDQFSWVLLPLSFRGQRPPRCELSAQRSLRAVDVSTRGLGIS